MSTLVVALRHGRLGIEPVIRSFGMGKGLLKDTTDGLLPYIEVPSALSAFFRRIKKSFKTESRTTQRFIRIFLRELCASYEFKNIAQWIIEKKVFDQLRFVGQRILEMTNNLSRAIQQ